MTVTVVMRSTHDVLFSGLLALAIVTLIALLLVSDGRPAASLFGTESQPHVLFASLPGSHHDPSRSCFAILDLVYASLDELHFDLQTRDVAVDVMSQINVEARVQEAARYLHDVYNCLESVLTRDE